MTKSLTEQWKDGELKSGMYYLKMTDTDGSISRDEYFSPYGFINWLPEDIKEVLAPVPSYEEFVQQREFVKDHQNVLIENMNLKQQLAIATKALKKMAKDNFQCAEQALEEIELRR